MRVARWFGLAVLLAAILSAAGCATRVAGLSNEQAALLHEQTTGVAVPKRTNLGLYFAYPVYGFLMDVVSSPLDLCTLLLDEFGRDWGEEVDRFMAEKRKSGSMSLGYGTILTLYGACVVTRGAVVVVDNGVLRHGAGDYYSMTLGTVPKSYFFPHLNNWPFRPYDTTTLRVWAATDVGKKAIEAFKAAHPPAQPQGTPSP